jgi:hypothetical protein
MSHKNFRTLVSSLVVSLSATAAWAETVQAPVGVLSSPVASLSFPGVFGVPSAVAPKGGSGFAGLTYVNPRGGIAGSGGDASLSAGYTVGNPVENLSVTFGVSITGIDPFGDAGSFSVSASRLLRAGGSSATFVGASASNLANWGAGSDEPEYSAYVSHLAGVQAGGVEIPLQIVLGYGTNNTRNSAGGLDDGAFAGFGVGIAKNLSASVSFTRTQLNAGLTATIPDTSVSASLGVLDATDRNDRQQVSLSVGFGF